MFACSRARHRLLAIPDFGRLQWRCPLAGKKLHHRLRCRPGGESAPPPSCSLAKSILPHAESGVPNQCPCRRSPLLSVQTVMPRKGAIFPPIAPTSLSDLLFLSFPPQPGPLIFPWLVVVAAPLQVAAAARTTAATSTILGFFSRARAARKVHLGAGAGLLRVRAGLLRARAGLLRARAGAWAPLPCAGPLLPIPFPS